MKIAEVTVNNASRASVGWVPDNANVDYLGFRVLMRPSRFLALATPLIGSNAKVGELLASGKEMASPFLEIKLPKEWFGGDLGEPAAVAGHEGRNRMRAVLVSDGDSPVEVHLLFRGGVRRRDVTPEMLGDIRAWLFPQSSASALPGPHFEVVK